MSSMEFSSGIAMDDLVMHTNQFHEMAQANPNAALSYWQSVQRMYHELGYEPAEFTCMSWEVDLSLQRFNTEIEELLYVRQED